LRTLNICRIGEVQIITNRVRKLRTMREKSMRKSNSVRDREGIARWRRKSVSLRRKFARKMSEFAS